MGGARAGKLEENEKRNPSQFMSSLTRLAVIIALPASVVVGAALRPATGIHQ